MDLILQQGKLLKQESGLILQKWTLIQKQEKNKFRYSTCNRRNKK